MKLGLAKTEEMNVFLMEYRLTPLECGFTPSELLMGRRIRSLLPTHPSNLMPILVDREVLLHRENTRIQRQKTNHDEKHYATESTKLEVGDEVWIKDIRMWGVVKQICKEPRSFVINCTNGNYRRTRSQLTKLLPCEDKEQNEGDRSEPDKDERPLRAKKEEESVTEGHPESTQATQDVTNLRRGTRIRKKPDFYYSDPTSQRKTPLT